LKFDEGYRTIFPDVSIKAMPVLHGKNDTLGDYESSAFFVRYDRAGQEFLFFGDVSPDSLVGPSSKPKNIAVWRAAAPKIPATLSAIFIECSWPSGRPDELLYGHLSPEHLVDELAILAEQVVAARDAAAAAAAAKGTSSGSSNSHNDNNDNSGNKSTAADEEAKVPKRKKRRKNRSADAPPAPPLSGLRVYIMHCKEDLEQKYDRPICHVIRDQVEALVRDRGLGIEVLTVEQGMRISTFSCGCRFENIALIRSSLVVI
jgi:3',5'-cyclic-nucleotide phosphodiesterase